MTSGPIPPHPYYDKSDPQLHIDLPAPKVKREGEQYYQQAQGTVGMVLQVEGQRVPSGYRRNSTCTAENLYNILNMDIFLQGLHRPTLTYHSDSS